ncbi:MAG: OmpA family protein [Desulfobacteraceae bacterium]|nr:OmpA family protein [Desulfobacteraceae bacterium]
MFAGGKGRLLLIMPFLLSAVFAVGPALAANQNQAGEMNRGPVVVHFGKNKFALNEASISKIKILLETYALGKMGRIFVVGYTDSTGAKLNNYKLSRKRAQKVRQELILSFGLHPEKVIAIGKGPENPTGDNRKKQGRAQNRRAEIYLSHVVNRSLKEKYGSIDPNLEAIDDLVENAREMVRRDQYDSALKLLSKARDTGANRYSSWHEVYAIAGFLTDMPMGKVKEHLQTAMRLDPDNREALGFLSRVTARENVSAGLVTASMGRSTDDPIKVLSPEQQYEYLHLFQAEPVAHHQMAGRIFDVWECYNAQQQPVVYYFKQVSKDDSKSLIHKSVASETGPDNTAAPVSDLSDTPANGMEGPLKRNLKKEPGIIWESDLFQ